MIISAVDQLVCVDEADSYASSMGVEWPVGYGDAQYYTMKGSKVDAVSPVFSNEKYLKFFPQYFSAVTDGYYVPDANDVFTFRLNSMTGDSAIIAQGTLSTFALKNGNTIWNQSGSNTAGVEQKYADLFKATQAEYNNITVPAIGIKGQPAYGTQSDLTIFCTIEFDGGSITCKGTMLIRPAADDAYRVAIGNVSSLGGDDTVIDQKGEHIYLTASLLLNGTATTTIPYSYRWMKNGTTIPGQTSATLDVDESMVEGHAEFSCAVVPVQGMQEYTGSIEIDDVQDRYAIVKNRTVKAYIDNVLTTVTSTNVLKSGHQVTYTPSVVDTRDNSPVSPQGWTMKITVKNNKGAVVVPEATIAPTQSGGTYQWGTSAVILGSSVKTWGGANVHITATNSNI